MKSIANFSDVNQIKLGYEKGMKATEISDLLKIDLKCVASFEPSKKAAKQSK